MLPRQFGLGKNGGLRNLNVILIICWPYYLFEPIYFEKSRIAMSFCWSSHLESGADKGGIHVFVHAMTLK